MPHQSHRRLACNFWLVRSQPQKCEKFDNMFLIYGKMVVQHQVHECPKNYDVFSASLRLELPFEPEIALKYPISLRGLFIIPCFLEMPHKFLHTLAKLLVLIQGHMYHSTQISWPCHPSTDFQSQSQTLQSFLYSLQVE